MAYDKVVDSAVLDAGLKQIADAIREKAGTSDNLDFPTAMAEAIAAIEAGGVQKVAYGTITPDASKTNILLTHNLGEIPAIGVFCKITDVNTVSSSEMLVVYQDGPTAYYIYKATDSLKVKNNDNLGMTTTYTTYTFNKANTTNVYTPSNVVAGNTYFWLVMSKGGV